MKKILAVLLALAMILSLAACGGSGSGSSTPAPAPAKETKTVPVSIISYNNQGEESYRTVNTYDENGFMISTAYKYAGESDEYNYYYDNVYADGYLASRTTTDGDMYSETHEEFDSNGNILKSEMYFADYPEQNFSRVYHYNDKGLCEAIEYIFDTDAEGFGERPSGSVFEYNADGTVALMTYSYDDIQILNKYIYEDNGRKKTEISYYDGDHLISSVTVTEYNADGNPVVETTYSPALTDKKVGGYYQPYMEYYTEGSMPDMSHFYESEILNYAYDADGNQIEYAYKYRMLGSYEDLNAPFEEYTGRSVTEYETIEVENVYPDLVIPEGY